MKRFLLVFITLGFVACAQPVDTFTVTRIIDGDTIKVVNDSTQKEDTVRLLGIDTPETTRGKNEPCGEEADEMISFLTLNRKVYLESDITQGDRDYFDRILRYVFVEGSEVSVNEILIQSGMAKEYTYSKDYKYKDQFLVAQQSAQQNNYCLWTN